MDFDKLFPGRFIKAGEFGGRDLTLTIAKVELDELEGDKGKEVKAIMSFQGAKKTLVLNKTNATCIKAMFGRDTDAWIGKRVTFFPAKESFGDSDICIRVRGSPDIAKPIAIDAKLGRRKLKVTMVKTGQKPAAKQPQKPPPPPEPDEVEYDPNTGEVVPSEEELAEALDAAGDGS